MNGPAFELAKMGDLCVVVTAREGASSDERQAVGRALRDAGFGKAIILGHGYELAGGGAVQRLLGRWLKRMESCTHLSEAEPFARCYIGLSRALGVDDSDTFARLRPVLEPLLDGTATTEQLFGVISDAWADLAPGERRCPDCGGEMGSVAGIDPPLLCDCGKALPNPRNASASQYAAKD